MPADNEGLDTVLEVMSATVHDAYDDERQRLVTMLDQHRWRRDDTARALGMSRSTLFYYDEWRQREQQLLKLGGDCLDRKWSHLSEAERVELRTPAR